MMMVKNIIVDYNWSSAEQLDNNQRPQYNNRRNDGQQQGYSNRGGYTQRYNRGGSPRRGKQPYRGAPCDERGILQSPSTRHHISRIHSNLNKFIELKLLGKNLIK